MIRTSARKAHSVVALGALVLALLVAAGSPSAAVDGSSCGLTAWKALPALVLPRASVVGPSAHEFCFAPGVLEAANMYFPEEAPVFEVIHSEPTLEMACTLSEMLGEAVPDEIRSLAAHPSPDPAPPGSEGMLYLGNLSISCLVNGNYHVSWTDRSPFGASDMEPGPALDTEGTIAAAEAFFRDREELLPDGAILTYVVPTSLVTRGSGGETVVGRSAVYRRFHNGFPEGRFAVEVNGRGEVCSVLRNMRDIQEVGVYPILSPDEAREALSSEAARVEGLSRPGVFAEAMIESVAMEYYDGAVAWDMDTIQPVYCFKGTASDTESGITREFKATVPAVCPEFVAPVELARPGVATP